MRGHLKFAYEAPNRTEPNHIVLNQIIHDRVLWKLNDTTFCVWDLVHQKHEFSDAGSVPVFRQKST